MKYGPLGKEEVLQYLPHRDPFLFVDEIVEINIAENFRKENSLQGSTIIGRNTFHKDMPIFKGHFPGFPLTPGVVMVESMAQISIFCLYPFIKLDKNNLVKLVAVDNARFRGMVKPGDTMEVFTKAINHRGSFISSEAKATVNKKIVAEAKLMAIIPDITGMIKKL